MKNNRWDKLISCTKRLQKTWKQTTFNLWWTKWFCLTAFTLYLPMPSGKTWSKFWETSKSVKEVRPLISSGRHSNLFSETSRQSRFFRFPTSCDTRQKKNLSHAQTRNKAIRKMYHCNEIPEGKTIPFMTSKLVILSLTSKCRKK